MRYHECTSEGLGMSVGPREAQRRALREKGAGGIVVLEKPRRALPSAKASPGWRGPERSKGYALLVRGLPEAMRGRLDRTRAKRGLRSVNDAILELLDEGAEK